MMLPVNSVNSSTRKGEKNERKREKENKECTNAWIMKSSCIIALFMCTEAFTPSSTARSHKTCLSISGGEKRSNRQSIAPLSPNTGATGTPGPISNNYRRTSSPPRRLRDGTSTPVANNRHTSPLPDQSIRDTTRDVGNSIDTDKAQMSSPPLDKSLQQEIKRLKQTLKERDDDVEILIYEVNRLQELSSKVKDANDARSNDFTLLKKEAERLKQDFAQRTEMNEEKLKRLMERLQEREQRVIQLEQQLNQNTKTISDLESQLNGIASPSIGVTPERIPQRQYRATKSYQETKNAAVLGGAPISYRSRSQKQYWNGASATSNVYRPTEEIELPVVDEMSFDQISDVETTIQPMMSNVDEPLNEVGSTLFDVDEDEQSTTRAADRYQKPHGIGVGNKGMLEAQNDS